jgi:hypothetical protein
MSAQARFEATLQTALTEKLSGADVFSGGGRLFHSGNGRRREWNAQFEGDGWWTATSVLASGLPAGLEDTARNHGSLVTRGLTREQSLRLSVSVPVEAPAEIAAALDDIEAIDHEVHEAPHKNQPDFDRFVHGLAELGRTARAKQDRLTATLETSAGLFQAAVSVRRPNRLSAEIQVCDLSDCEPCSRRAAAYALLRAATQLRLVQGALLGDHEPAAGFVSVAPLESSAERLEASLGALSVACDFFARELRALRDPALAARYLELQGISNQ